MLMDLITFTQLRIRNGGNVTQVETPFGSTLRSTTQMQCSRLIGRCTTTLGCHGQRTIWRLSLLLHSSIPTQPTLLHLEVPCCGQCISSLEMSQSIFIPNLHLSTHHVAYIPTVHYPQLFDKLDPHLIMILCSFQTPSKISTRNTTSLIHSQK